MKRLGAVLLLIVICCSACSFQPRETSLESYIDDSSVSLQSESDNDKTFSTTVQKEDEVEPETPDTNLSEEDTKSPAQAAKQADSNLSSTTSNYQGMTEEQWQILQDQKEKYGALSEDERSEALFNGLIDCRNFIHLWWEHSIAIELIRYVGGDEFNQWTIERENTGECIDIYSFAMQFSITQEELISLIEENNLTHIYDVETVKSRYTYFKGVQDTGTK